MLPSAQEAAALYMHYNNQQTHWLDQLRASTMLTDSEWFEIVAVVDGHMRYFHKSDLECPKECEVLYLRKIISLWEATKVQGRPVEDIEQSIAAVRQVWGFLRQILFQKTRPDTAEILLAAEPGISDNIDDVVLHVSILRWGEQLMPRLILSGAECLDLWSLNSKVKQYIQANPPQMTVVVLFPNGLTACVDDSAWKNALTYASVIDWMEKELKVLVNIDGVIWLSIS